jgi:outer membrane biosynthesis protein TonB
MSNFFNVIVLKAEEKTLKFHKKRIIFGTIVSSDVRLNSNTIDPIHAVLEKGKIFDLASNLGVMVNDKKVVTSSLKNGDVISIGNYQWIYSLEEVTRDDINKKSTREVEGRILFLNPKEDLSPFNLQNNQPVVEIFDYRSTSQQALEGVMSWNGTILSVQHFVHQKFVKVGPERKNDFCIPAFLSSNSFPIAIKNKDEFTLNLDTQMKGVVQKSGELFSLDEIRKKTHRGNYGFEVSMGKDDFAKISVQNIDFYFIHTDAPPRLKIRKIFDRDPFLMKILFTSMVLTGFFFYGLSKVSIDTRFEVDQVPERIATILYQPEKFIKTPELPKPEPIVVEKSSVEVKKPVQPLKKPVVRKIKVVALKKPLDRPIPKMMHSEKTHKVKKTPKHQLAQKESHEGSGARAKALEGSRGELKAKTEVKNSTTMSRVSGKHQQGALANSQVDDEGNVDLLKGVGGKMENILGSTTAHLGEGGDQWKGFGNFNSQGSGGLALAGRHSGGGGNAETTLGGVGKQGTGMGRVGTGKGALGGKTGVLGGSHVQLDLQDRGESVVMGAIDREAIAQAIYAHRDEFRLCYEHEINAENPHISGILGTSFVIGSSGHVTRAGIESSSLHNPQVERCVLQVLRTIAFPLPQGGGVVEVRFPFKFTSR